MSDEEILLSTGWRKAMSLLNTRVRSMSLLLLSTLAISSSSGQISPGQLTSAHAQLEGMSNCTQCHTLGAKVENDKCLSCHDDISSLIDRNRGYHVSSEVKGRDCFACHSEHHGRNFEMVRFDADKFNHRLTGYTLTGAHQSLDCKACHNARMIKDPEIRRRPDTYLGLETDCKSCHTDFHQGTLGTTCTQCHTTTSFVPATEFSHAETDFPLKGAHQNVDCASCHAVYEKNGTAFQEFAGVAFVNCSSCHADPHEGRFGRNCKECHVEESFHLFRGMENFNHNKTGFPLKGKHRSISCAECHNTKVQTDQMFKDFTNRDVSNCIACHADVHEEKFGTDCRACHSEESFRAVRNFTSADHAKTDFPLEGRHITVDCRKCHETRMTEPVAFNACASCHADYHEGQFVSDGRAPDCASCHTVDGFAGSTFTVEQHSETRFALTGAHLATPCFACHLREEEWAFRSIGTECIACHEDIHDGSIPSEYYPGNACQNCHTTDAWTAVEFDHSVTGWALEGRHDEVACTDCHRPDEPEKRPRTVLFSGLESQCATCHDNVHRDQFEQNGITDCARCHTPVHWKPSSFNHADARFPLEGAHLEVACGACHTPEHDQSGDFVLYRLEKLACADCHM